MNGFRSSNFSVLSIWLFIARSVMIRSNAHDPGSKIDLARYRSHKENLTKGETCEFHIYSTIN